MSGRINVSWTCLCNRTFTDQEIARKHAETCDRRPYVESAVSSQRTHIEPARFAIDGEWRCFHCDEVFIDRAAAAAHFGTDQSADPACVIAAQPGGGLVTRLRELEAELTSYRLEDTQKDREYHALVAKHAVDLRREEERGYEKGLKDAQPPVHPIGELKPVDGVIDDNFVLAFTDDGRAMLWKVWLLHHALNGRTPDHLQFPATKFIYLKDIQS